MIIAILNIQWLSNCSNQIFFDGVVLSEYILIYGRNIFDIVNNQLIAHLRSNGSFQ